MQFLLQPSFGTKFHLSLKSQHKQTLLQSQYQVMLVLQRMQKRTTFLFRVLQPLPSSFKWVSFFSLSMCFAAITLQQPSFSLSDCALEMVLHNFCFSLSLSLSIFPSLNMFIPFSLSRTRTKVVLFVLCSLFFYLSLSLSV